MLIGDVATGSKGRKVIMINVVALAFFEAPMRRRVCVELPPEERSDGDQVGLLMMSLYGTRDAAVNFQREVSKFMKGVGFVQGRYNPCTYYHRQQGLKTMVRGDDFVTCGPREGAEWFRQMFEGRCVIKTNVVGLGKEESREARFLNRLIRARSA